MLVIPPTLFRKNYTARKQQSGAPTPPAQTIEVFYVSTDDPPSAGYSFWVFNTPVTMTGVPTGLRVMVGGVWLEPSSASLGTGTEFAITYDTTEPLDGCAWSITGAPGNIVQAAEVIVPQGGDVSAP